MGVNTAASPPEVAAHFAAHRLVSFSVYALAETQSEPFESEPLLGNKVQREKGPKGKSK